MQYIGAFFGGLIGSAAFYSLGTFIVNIPMTYKSVGMTFWFLVFAYLGYTIASKYTAKD